MNNLTTQGLVLRRVNYGEADRILTVLSSDLGKISAIAKGSRKLKSKLAGGIEPFALNEMTLHKGKGSMYTVISTRMLDYYGSIIKDLDSSSYASRIIKELESRLEDETGQEFFKLLKDSFRLLNIESRPPAIGYSYFFINFLKAQGQGLNPFHDEAGEALKEANSYNFNHESSCFEPLDSSSNKIGKYTKDDIKLARVLSTESYDLVLRTKILEDQANKLKQLVDNHLSLYM